MVELWWLVVVMLVDVGCVARETRRALDVWRESALTLFRLTSWQSLIAATGNC
jgi:hypothetical protein